MANSYAMSGAPHSGHVAKTCENRCISGCAKPMLCMAWHIRLKSIRPPACERYGVAPYISVGRERRTGGLERFREPPPLRAGATTKEPMQHRQRTKAGRAIY